MPISEVYNCDCLEYMRSLPDKYFDLCIADPPYGINAAKMGMGGTKDHRRVARKLYKEHTKKGRLNNGSGKLKNRTLNNGSGKLKNRTLNRSNIDWDNTPPTAEVFKEMVRVSKNQIIWGGNYFDLPPTRCVICWDKIQPWENFSQIEMAWTSFDFPASLFRFDNRTGDKIHPTQKPIALYSWLLDKYANNTGNKIFDPFLGSGSSRIAAYKKGFDFYACELDKDYYEAQEERFRRECLGEIKTKSGKIITEQSLF